MTYIINCMLIVWFCSHFLLSAWSQLACQEQWQRVRSVWRQYFQLKRFQTRYASTIYTWTATMIILFGPSQGRLIGIGGRAAACAGATSQTNMILWTYWLCVKTLGKMTSPLRLRLESNSIRLDSRYWRVVKMEWSQTKCLVTGHLLNCKQKKRTTTNREHVRVFRQMWYWRLAAKIFMIVRLGLKASLWKLL